MVRRAMVQAEVVGAATRLFKEKGIRGVSLQAIADEVGLTKGALYHYFESRDDLLRHVVGDWINEEFESLRERVSHAGTATEQLRDYVRHHVASVANNVDLYSLSFSSEAELPADIRAEFRRLRRQSDNVLKAILHKGVTDREFEPRDEKIIAFAIDGMCNWLWKWYAPDGPKSPADVAEDFIELLLRGLLRNSDNDNDNDNVVVDQTQNAINTVEYHARAIRFHSERLESLLPALASSTL